MTEHRVQRLRADPWGTLLLILTMITEVVTHLPRMWRLRRLYRRRRRPAEPVVVLMGDNMDATHGISVSSQRLVHDLRLREKNIFMVGISHSQRTPGPRTQDGSVHMIRPSVVQDLFGYPGQELAFPSLKEVCELLAHTQVDIIEIESPGTFGLLVIVLGPWLGISIIQNYRTDLISYFRMLLDSPLFIGFLEWYTRSFLNCGDRVVVPSKAFFNDVLDFGLARSKVVQLPRGVELGRFHPSKADRSAWTAHGAPAQGRIVLFLGRVSKEKGLDLLIEAWPLILRKHPDLILGVVGDGPFRAEFQRRTKDLGPTVFTGMVLGDELPALVGSATLLAFPSTTDTFGNAVLEALAAGIPAVVTDQGGPCEIVEDGKSGRIVAGNDLLALVQGMDDLLSRPDLSDMRRDARLRAEGFSPEAATTRQWEFFCDVQASRRNLR